MTDSLKNTQHTTSKNFDTWENSDTCKINNNLNNYVDNSDRFASDEECAKTVKYAHAPDFSQEPKSGESLLDRILNSILNDEGMPDFSKLKRCLRLPVALKYIETLNLEEKTKEEKEEIFTNLTSHPLFTLRELSGNEGSQIRNINRALNKKFGYQPSEQELHIQEELLKFHCSRKMKFQIWFQQIKNNVTQFFTGLFERKPKKVKAVEPRAVGPKKAKQPRQKASPAFLEVPQPQQNFLSAYLPPQPKKQILNGEKIFELI